MTGQIMVCVKKGKERERDRGEEKHTEKVNEILEVESKSFSRN